MLKSIKARLQNKKGFTLLEVVAVLAVLGVLAAILVPNVGSVNTAATQTKASSDLQVIDSALALYWSQNNQTYPATLTDANLVALLPASFDATQFVYAPAGTAPSQTYSLTTKTIKDSKGALLKSPGSK